MVARRVAQARSQVGGYDDTVGDQEEGRSLSDSLLLATGAETPNDQRGAYVDRVNSVVGDLRDLITAPSEFRITLSGDAVKHVHAIRHPVLNDAGDVVKLIGTVMDVTERKRAEEERLRAEFREDIDIERLASELAVDAVVPHRETLNETTACVTALAASPARRPVRQG